MANNIEVEGLTRKFKNGPLAVAGIDLQVDPGEIYGFLGPNGAGKSTTVHMLTTLLPPTGGAAGSPATTSSTKARAVRGAIGVALQEAALDPHLTAREHMRLQTALHGLPRAERVAPRRRADRAGRPRRRRRPQGRRLLGRDETPARPRRWPSSTARASSSSTSRRPASTRRAGRRCGTRSRRLAGEDGVTVFLTTQYLEEADAARRPGRDHRRRQDRRRGHAGRAQGRDRPAEPRGRRPREPAERDRVLDVLERFGERVPAGPRRASPSASTSGADAAGRRRPGARRRGTRGSPTSSSTRRRSTTSSSRRPAATSRAPATTEMPTGEHPRGGRA